MGVHRIVGMARRAAIISALALFGSLALASTALAAKKIGFSDSPGTGAPPAKLGGYQMTKFGLDSRPYTLVTYAPGPKGKVFFAIPMNHVRVGVNWLNWGNGYFGDVYWTGNSVYSDTLYLPAGTQAFYFYMQPDQFGTYTFTAKSGKTSSGSVSITSSASGNSAQYFGFYAKKPSVHLTSIKISGPTNTTEGFAVGEFGIAR